MGRLKALIGLVVLGIGLAFMWLVVPLYFNNYQFQDDVNALVKFAGDKSEDAVRNEVMKKATEHSIPITLNDIQVSRVNGALNVNIEYDVTVDFQVRQNTYHFVVTSSP
jgi:hypothetical protein